MCRHTACNSTGAGFENINDQIYAKNERHDLVGKKFRYIPAGLYFCYDRVFSEKTKSFIESHDFAIEEFVKMLNESFLKAGSDVDKVDEILYEMLIEFSKHQSK